jgi:hypothetical protein
MLGRVNKERSWMVLMPRVSSASSVKATRKWVCFADLSRDARPSPRFPQAQDSGLECESLRRSQDTRAEAINPAAIDA